MAASLAVRCFNVRHRKCPEKCGQALASLFSTQPRVGETQPEDKDNDKTEKKNKPISLRVLQAERQEQAERSVLINCNSRTNADQFLKYLSNHGHINKCFFYESLGTHAVVEFSDWDGVQSLIESARIPRLQHSVLPFKSRMLSLCSSNPKQPSTIQYQPQTTAPISDLMKQLVSCANLEEQITMLIDAYSLTDENTRLRFLVCSLVKDIAAAFNPNCTVTPFGSSVNGFGKLGCDLDMTLVWHDGSEGSTDMPPLGMYVEYQMKSSSNDRAVTQRILTVLAHGLEEFGPSCVGVQKILNARCPLIRFGHSATGFQCDLTTSNSVALWTTELLYLLGELDPRVRPLVVTVRCWARTHGITSSTPGAWITNFSLTLMVVFFLQTRSPPILPTLDHLKNLSDPSEKCVVDGHDCTFTSDFDRIHLETNTDTLVQLLGDFFEFFSKFSFNKDSINIRTGKTVVKPEGHPLHIQNPFEPLLNVSKNVSAAQIDRFKLLCREAAWTLQVSPDLPTLLQSSSFVEKKKKKRGKTLTPANNIIKGLLESIRTKNNEQQK